MAFFAVLPSLVAISLIYLLKKPHIALISSCLLSIILLVINPTHQSLPTFDLNYALQILSVLFALLCLSALLGIFISNGAINRLTDFLLLKIKSEKQAGILVCVLGLIFHQGGTVSAMVVGFTTLLLTQRLGMTRTKHAFLLDTTASPVAILIPSSPWFYLISLGLTGLIPQIKDVDQAWDFLMGSLSFQYYGFIATLSAFVIASNPSFLKNLSLYQNTIHEASLLDQKHHLNTQKVGLIDLIMPLLTFFLMMIFLRAKLGLFALAISAMASLLLSLFFCWYRGLSLVQILENDLHLIQKLGMGGQLLVLAMIQSFLSQKLGLNELFVSWVGSSIPLVFMPALCAILGFLASLSTGTALGSLSLLSPMVLSLAYQSNHDLSFTQLCFASLVGACVCGDHCSPISDTTIASSFFSACPLKDHVQTQFPIALICLGISMILSTVCVFYYI